jgi:RHS repeat-associated protein
LTYTGREDDQTGLLYYRARYYDPEAEIFISQDPLGDAQRYVGGNPLSFTDPLGLYKLGTDGSLIPENNQERQTLWESGGVVDVTPEAVLDVVLTLYGGCKGAVSEIKPLIGFSQAGFKNALKQRGTGFVGQAGFELKNPSYQVIRNQAAKIKDINFSAHALDQMQNRGILPSIVKNAINTGERFNTRAGTIGFYDVVNNIRVIVSTSTGKVVTVIRGKP